jgi:UDP-N-acetylmuramate--alanine ligase
LRTLNYHFVGIGGIGMSGLARIAISQGAVVSGSDKADSHILAELRALGATVAVGHSAENVPPGAIVVTTDAIKGANPEVDAARARGQEVIRRSELLGRMMERHEGIAISGTHGKTSTTAMVARIMLESGLDPSVVVGGEALGADRTAHAGTGRYFVAEACEAYGSFVHLAPRIAVVTNIEADHLDFHGSLDHIRAAFRQFTGMVIEGGVVVANADDVESAALAGDCACRTITYGLRSGDWRAMNLSFKGMSSRFDVYHQGEAVATVHLEVPGEHNVSNALAAFVVGVEVGLAARQIADALGSYRGVGRRFELLGERDGVYVYDDYAHHPTEVRVTLSAARRAFPGRIIAVFQPHLYSRTRDFLDDFVAAFNDADAVIVTEIFKSREEPIPGVSGRAIADGIVRRTPGKTVRFVEDKAEVPALARSFAKAGDVLIVMGAGDIRAAGEAYVRGDGA